MRWAWSLDFEYQANTELQQGVEEALQYGKSTVHT
jgi:hypothetical protein